MVGSAIEQRLALAHRCARAFQVGHQAAQPGGLRLVGKVGAVQHAEVGRALGPLLQGGHGGVLQLQQFVFEQHLGGIQRVLARGGDKALQPLARGGNRARRIGKHGSVAGDDGARAQALDHIERGSHFVEFDFAIGEPELFVEMILTHAAFAEFCSANQVELMPALPEVNPEDEAEQWDWRMADATQVRFKH